MAWLNNTELLQKIWFLSKYFLRTLVKLAFISFTPHRLERESGLCGRGGFDSCILHLSFSCSLLGSRGVADENTGPVHGFTVWMNKTDTNCVHLFGPECDYWIALT